jgi:sigma-B regulation protein RsbU (phosphoserine phosphatase)
MPEVQELVLRDQLSQRRRQLEKAVSVSRGREDLVRLMEQVDRALERMDHGTYGLCEECHDPIEADRLLADPLLCFCLDHLSPDEQRSLQMDLDLASRVQRALLPKQSLAVPGWEIRYHYEPAGPVSGDYCDLVDPGPGDGGLFFLFGDVSGKGVAASMLMARLHAILRALIDARLPTGEIMGRANRLFCESALPASFATLVCGRAGRNGEVEVGNAGHCPPLLVRNGRVARIEATGLPVGLFCTVDYPVERVSLSRGDTLFLYTDGLSEARSADRQEYGIDRLAGLLEERHELPVPDLIGACLDDLRAFRSGAPRTDDLTLMVIRRTE